jgi:hypothetical protein
MFGFTKDEKLEKLEAKHTELRRKIQDREYELSVLERELYIKKQDFQRTMQLEKEDFERKQKEFFAQQDEMKKKHAEEITRIKEEAKTQRENDSITLKLNFDKQLNEKEKVMNDKLVAEMQRLQEENYRKLAESLSKLHEEGNVTTKFMGDIAKGLIGDYVNLKEARLIEPKKEINS